MKFAMTDEEIKRSYQNAENFKDQVRILAELNAVPVQDMARKMKALGLDVDMRWYAQAPEKKPKKEEIKYVNVNEELQNLKDEVMRLNETNKALSELLQVAKAKASQAEKYRKIITILMEEEA